MSAVFARRMNAAWPSGVFRFSVIARLLRCRFWKSKPWRLPVISSPSVAGGSILITSAPQSARCRTAVGPARASVRSSTFSPFSGRRVWAWFNADLSAGLSGIPRLLSVWRRYSASIGQRSRVRAGAAFRRPDAQRAHGAREYSRDARGAPGVRCRDASTAPALRRSRRRPRQCRTPIFRFDGDRRHGEIPGHSPVKPRRVDRPTCSVSAGIRPDVLVGSRVSRAPATLYWMGKGEPGQ